MGENRKGETGKRNRKMRKAKKKKNTRKRYGGVQAETSRRRLGS
jgi:hypothetical protein